MDLALNNLLRLICHKTQQTKPFGVKPCLLLLLYINFVALKVVRLLSSKAVNQLPTAVEVRFILLQNVGINRALAVRVFANGPGDLGSILGRVIPKTQKMVLDASLLNTQHYKVRIKGKVEQSRERSRALPYTLV